MTSMAADTISPTAVVDAGQAYTNAVNVTVNITFSKACNNGGGFVCTGTNSCDVSCSATMFHASCNLFSTLNRVDVFFLKENGKVLVLMTLVFSKLLNLSLSHSFKTVPTAQLLVYGAGVVIPSTLKETERGLRYSVVVGLSTQVLSGRVTAVLAKRTCADAAGNFFQRTETSRFVIRFGNFVHLHLSSLSF